MKKKYNVTITHQFDGVHISPKDYEQLLAFLEWEEVPPFIAPGRTAWYVLKEDALAEGARNPILRAAKMKGVAYWNPVGKTKKYNYALNQTIAEKPTYPSNEIAFESLLTYPHFGLTVTGEYTTAYSKPAPLGGITYERALREYKNAVQLYRHGVPCTIPLMVVRFSDNYQFEGEPMGAVICLAPESRGERLSTIQFGKAVKRGLDSHADAYYDEIRAAIHIDGNPELETTRLKTLTYMARQVGKIIHDFSAAGLFRHASGWANFEFNRATKQVYLTDLDSSLPLEIRPPEAQALEVLRDLGSTAYRMLSKYAYPSVLGDYTLSNLLRFDPLYELLLGYFPTASEQEIKSVSKRLWNYFIPHWMLLQRHKEAILTEWSIERRMSYKVDHHLFYVLIMTLVFPLYRKSDLFDLYPTDLTMDDMLEKAKGFLGERYDHFLYLLDGDQSTNYQNSTLYVTTNFS